MLELPFDELHDLSLSEPEMVWHEIAQQVVWDKLYTSVVLDKHLPTPNWFVDGEINMSYNCLDRAVEEGLGEDVAVIFESPATNTREEMSYKQLLESVELLAGVMVNKCNIMKGDIVLLHFPVIPQCLIAMLACTRIGATYSLVYGGFPPQLISDRIQLIKPKLIVTCNVGYKAEQEVNYKDNIDEAIKIGKFISNYCIVFNRPNTEPGNMVDGRDLDWLSEVRFARPQPPIPIESNHPMFIIYTSGTTGEPKGLVMGTGNSIVTHKYQMKYLFGIKPSECWWMLSDFVWITGQTNMSFGSLLNRSVTILYEGEYSTGTDAAHILNIIRKNKVVSFGLTPTIIRMLRNSVGPSVISDPFPHLRFIYTGGEVSESETRDWISKFFQCPIYEVFGQTETSGLVTSPGHLFKKSGHEVPMLGFKPKIIDTETGLECATGTIGRLLFHKPMCPCMALTFYKNHELFLNTYFNKYPGYYDTFDNARLMDSGKIEILSRIDDIIHVAAARICGRAVEEICLKNENLVNAVVVPLNDSILGQVPFGFLVKHKFVNTSDIEIVNETIRLVNEHIGTYAQLTKAVIVPDLPTTRNHKISKHSLTSMVNEKDYQVPSTVINQDIYQKIYNILIGNGLPAKMPIM